MPDQDRSECDGVEEPFNRLDEVVLKPGPCVLFYGWSTAARTLLLISPILCSGEARPARQVAQSLLVQVTLAPPVEEDDVGQGAAAYRTEVAHWKTDGQDGIGVDTLRQAQDGFHFLLEAQVAGG